MFQAVMTWVQNPEKCFDFLVFVSNLRLHLIGNNIYDHEAESLEQQIENRGHRFDFSESLEQLACSTISSSP